MLESIKQFNLAGFRKPARFFLCEMPLVFGKKWVVLRGNKTIGKMIKKRFEKCMWEELSDALGLERVKNLDVLAKMTKIEGKIEADIEKNLIKLNHLLIDNFLDWNEDELKMQFISPLLYMVDYTSSQRYKPFSQRPMKMKTPEVELSGVTEWMLASGQQIPKEPFFFLHEYKKEQGTDGDPFGQLLAAMLTAQHHNQDKNRPLYGTYIVGKDWYFVALQGKQYQNTLAYNVTELDKLHMVFQILTNVKSLI